MSRSNKIVLQVRFINPIEELLEIQSALHLLGPDDGGFELDEILCYELNKRLNFFLLDISKIETLKSFLDYIGLKYVLTEREVKEFYDSNIIRTTILSISDLFKKDFKKALEDEILAFCEKDEILDKIGQKGINSLTPLDKYILRK